ncbi:MAG TPA: glycosyltransferase family 2 protein [Blastocatellia bacterium]|nr:glycosyltransferase family 2 protein [Blastocatellia bacterium]
MTVGAAPLVSVILPIRNEAHYIARSLGAVLAQDYPADRMEVMVVDGMSTDGTREIVESMSAGSPRVQLIDNIRRIAPTALNAGIARAGGEIIIRVDGHCEIERDYVRRCVEHLRNDGVDGVGGPLQTIGESFVARGVSVAMSSTFGVGDSAFRTVSNKTMLVDTVAFPAYTRDIVERVGFFDEELVRNQDDDYNYRLRKVGAKVLLASDVRSRYYSRSSIRSLWRQYFQYGYWKVRVMQKHPRQMRPRQFVPPLFVATLLLSLAAAPLSLVFGAWFAWPFVLAAGSYTFANLAASISITVKKRDWPLSWLLPIAFATLHVSYGLGFLVGLIKFRNRWGGHNDRRPNYVERNT